MREQSHEQIMILFAYDHKWVSGLSPHSFAYFYETTGDACEIVNDFSISWMPRSSPDDVKVFGPEVEGKNYTLRETLDYASRNNKRVSARGPYRISRDLYDMAKAQSLQLGNREAGYKVTSVNRQAGRKYYHCVYAISDLLITAPLMKNYISHSGKSLIRLARHFGAHILGSTKLTASQKAFLQLDHRQIKWVNDGSG